jgi:predicted transcriptional regulator
MMKAGLPGVTPMPRTIELDEEQARELEQLAARQRRTVDALVRQAVDGYLAQRQREEAARRADFEAVVASFREGVPPDMSPEEIEAEISAAWSEYRAERAAQLASDASGAADTRGR